MSSGRLKILRGASTDHLPAGITGRLNEIDNTLVVIRHNLVLGQNAVQ